MSKSHFFWIIITVACAVLLADGVFWWALKQNLVMHPVMQTAINTQTSTTPSNFILAWSNSTVGKYLIAENGMTLYQYAKDSKGVSTCYGSCAMNWPPYVIPNNMSIGNATSTEQLGTLVRTDGTVQLTYKGIPLYFYHGDTKPGDTNGQGVGGVWSVISL